MTLAKALIFGPLFVNFNIVFLCVVIVLVVVMPGHVSSCSDAENSLPLKRGVRGVGWYR